MTEKTPIRVLGPLVVERHGAELDLGVRRQRLVLGVLALWAGEPVRSGRLIEIAWFDREPPASARNAIQVCVSRLRPVLAGCASIAFVADGYRLDARPELIDVHRFRGHAAAARDLRGERRIAELRCAEDLWRGPVLAGELSDSARQQFFAGLDEERIATTEGRISAELALGRHRQLISELTDLVLEHPTRERLVAHLMLALYRDDQAARALQVCRNAREVFAEELGIDPGEVIRDLEVAILRQEPDLRHFPGTELTLAWSGPAAIPAQLPVCAHGFTGRREQLAALDALLLGSASAGARIALVTGSGGIGKTALAVNWAHRARSQFPDGQLYLDLRGYSAEAPMQTLDGLTRFLRAAGQPAQQLPADLADAVTAYRSLLADRRSLIVLDNAASADQVRPLLPGGTGCAVVVTSRDRLDGLVARDGAHLLPLDVLRQDEARALIALLLGHQRVTAEDSATAELARLCGHLPLALRVACSALVARPSLAIAAYVARLDRTDRLSTLAVDGDARSAIRAAFDESYAALAEPARRLFRLIGLIPGADITVPAAAALADLRPGSAERTLAALVSKHMVEERSPGRHGLHDLLRLYAVERASDEDDPVDRSAATGRLVHWYLATARMAARQLYPGQEMLGDEPVGDDLVSDEPADRMTGAVSDAASAIAWLNAERFNLVAVVEHASSAGLATCAWQLANALRPYFYHTGHMVQARQVAEAGLAAATSVADLRGQAAMRMSQGMVDHCQGRLSAAAVHYAAAYQLARLSRWHSGQHFCLMCLGNIRLQAGELRAADLLYQRALDLICQVGDLRAQGMMLTNLGVLSFQAGRLSEARQRHSLSVELARRIANQSREATALRHLGYTVFLSGDLGQAMGHLQCALRIDRQLGSRSGEAQVQMDIAAVHLDAGQLDQAEGAIEDALVFLNGEDTTATAVALNVRGRIKVATGRPRAATADYTRALDLAVRVCACYEEAESLIGLADVAVATGRWQDAAGHVESALDISRHAGYRVLTGQAMALLAVALEESGDRSEAIAQASGALELHRETGHRLGEARALALLGRLLRHADPFAASRHEQAARAIVASSQVGLA